MLNNIVFTNTMEILDDFVPKPAFQIVPDWYKNTESYSQDNKVPSGFGTTAATIKRCMPVFDALNSGYILVTSTDMWVSHREGEDGKQIPWYEWSSSPGLEFHPTEQALFHPAATGSYIPKWMNPWAIKTPPGYSTLFVAPFHRESPFNALPGVVDTDKYTAPVNIVFVLSNPNFEGLIPAGTPIVQVIPFKREIWKMKFGKEKDLLEQRKVAIRLKIRFFDAYKNMFRQSKEYR